jgi:hypothetical protein
MGAEKKGTAPNEDKIIFTESLLAIFFDFLGRNKMSSYPSGSNVLSLSNIYFSFRYYNTTLSRFCQVF